MKRTLFITLAVVSTAPAALAQQLSFSARQLPAGFDAPRYTSGFHPGTPVMQPIAADFLGNGRHQWYQGGNVISRFPESGTLTLPAITLPQTPSATVQGLTGAACDVDRDGDVDLVRINRWNGNGGTYTLQVFLNEGSGIFIPGYRVDWVNSPSYDAGPPYFSIVPGDFNGDGAPDLAIKEAFQKENPDSNPNRYDGKFYIRWNNGSGGFGSTSNLQQNGIPAWSAISAADYDRDGDLDLYCSGYLTFALNDDNGYGAVDIERSLLFTNGGAGTFTVGNNFSELKPDLLLDFNGDGWADLVSPSRRAFGDSVVTEYIFNDGTGLLDAPLNGQTIDNSSTITGLADFTGDGFPDVAQVTESGQLRIFKNGNPTLVSMGYFLQANSPAQADGLCAADADGDGDTDLLLSREDGTFLFVENTTLHLMPGATLAGSASVSGVTQLHSADFDRDGHDDIVAVMPSQKRLNLLFSQSTGLPSAPIAKGTQSESPHSAAVADFDQDGRPDIAYTLPATGEVRLIRSTAGFVPQWPDTAIATGIGGVSLLAAGEYGTPNGRPDLFAASGTTGQLRGLYQSGGSWSGQNIAATLSPVAQSIAVGHASSGAGDEVAYLSSGTASLSLSATQLNGGWSALGGTGRTETVAGGPHTAKVIWANVTGNTREEAVYINGTGGLSFWNLSTSPASVGSLGTAPSAIKDIVAVDWNGDGLTDILAATASGLSIYHSHRSGLQRLRSDLAVSPDGYAALATGDFNHDGRPDAAAAASGRIDYYLNAGSGLRANLSGLPAEVVVPSGLALTTVMNIPLSSNGRSAENGGTEDGDLHVTGAIVHFHEAVAGPGGTWVPGAPLSQVSDPVFRMELQGPAGIACSDNNIAFGPNGTQALDYWPASDVLSPISPGSGTVHSLRMGLFALDAPQIPSRFFVTIAGITAQERTSTGIGTLIPQEYTTLLQDSRPVLITSVPTRLYEWRFLHFGISASAGEAANDADPDNDGVPNVVEYLTGTNPTISEPTLNHARGLTLLPVATPQSTVRLRVVMENRALADPKVRVTIQTSASTASLGLYSVRPGGGTWSSGSPQGIPSDAGTTTTFLFNTAYTPANNPRQFFRLKVEELP